MHWFAHILGRYIAHVNSVQEAWSVVSWFRYAEPVPELGRGTIELNGETLAVSEPLDAAWAAEHRRDGAEIHDHDRGVTYRATTDQRGRLDYLEVVIDNGRLIDENAMRRVPVATIRRAVLQHLAAVARARADEGGDVIVIGMPGSLRERPTLEEIAELMADGHDRQALHARFRDVPKRTVDGWMRRARTLIAMTTEGK